MSSSVIHPAVRRVRHPLHFRLLEVRNVVSLTPHMVRITLGGDALAGFVSEGFDDHVKVLFALPGEAVPVMPVDGPEGAKFPEGVERGPMRDYTPRRHDPVAGELDIEFVLHGEGPGSSFAASARPGDKVGIAGPRGSFVIPDDFAWHLLVGDATALPAIARRVEELPAGCRVLAVIEVASAAEELPLVSRADLSVVWVHNTLPGDATALMAAVRTLALPDGEGYAWAGGEFHMIRELREHLLAERGLPRANLRAASYWRHGDGDDGEEE